MKHIVIATDLTADDDAALKRSCMLAQQTGAKLSVLYVCDSNEEKEAYSKALDEKIAVIEASMEYDVHGFVIVGDSYKAILDFVYEVSADLLVMGPHKKSKGKDGFASQTAIHLIRHSTLPVLMVKKVPLCSYNKILVAVDFSPPSQHAFLAAARLSPEADFFLLHTYDLPFSGFIGEIGAESEVRHNHDEQFDNVIGQVTQELMNDNKFELRVKKMLVRGSIKSEICSAAMDIPVQLVALGTRGNSGLARALLGSVAEELLMNPPCDLLIAH